MNGQEFVGTAQYNLIYIFSIDDEAHKGYLKIGEHSFSSSSSYKQLTDDCDELNKNAHSRIEQYTKTALIHYELLHTELARIQIKLSDGTIENSAFSDHDVHAVLDNSGFDVHKFRNSGKDSEWYKVSLHQAIAAIKAVKQGRHVLTAAEINGTEQLSFIPEDKSISRPQIILRDEQKACIAKTKSVFAVDDHMLWDCKMRFGKTITAYSLIKEVGYKKVLVVTHRPAVVDGWSSDFKLIFDDDRVFVTKSNIKEADRFTAEDASIDADNDRRLVNLTLSGTPFVYFASMQDLRGSKIAGGKFEKNRAVFSMDWDLIIYDEAHEGTQTELGQTVQNILGEPKAGKTPKKVLQLSGTPYNLLSKYGDDNVYSWDYVMEQRSKKEWDDKHPGDHNPYADLPELRICTFDLRNKMKTSYRYEDENIAFNFREFFRTWTGDPEKDFRPLPAGCLPGDFVHKDDVQEFLDLISSDSEETNYPFANQTYRDMFKHTFWILPGVKEARAFSTMLKAHPVFSAYEIVNVAGEGDVEQPYDDALRAVRSAINKYERTITLSCGKLTTGVTVKQWTGVMLLSGSSSTGAAGYMQTIFRVQSAGSIDGMQKKVCYAFDFAPDRALKVLSDVHKLKKHSVGTDDEGRVQLGEFLNFCPVLAEGDTGMEFYDVPKMMRQLKRLTVDAAVKSGFDDDSIYKADAGIVMDREKIALVDVLKARLTPQKKETKQTAVTVNEQGLTDEQYQKAQDAKRKRKKERTPEEEEALAKEREMKKKQQALFDLLRNISIRLPLLIFGSAQEFDDGINLEDFIRIVDDVSWREFMPKDVDKELFQKLLVFYDSDVIEGAGMRIRRMAKAADELMPTQRIMRIAEIFSCFRNPAKETVLTPWRIVNMHMGDTIGGYNFYNESYSDKDGLLEHPRLIEQDEITADIFLNEDLKILEMNSKSGLYPLYVAYSIYRMMLPKDERDMSLEEARAWWRKALDDHLFVLCQTSMAVSITKRTLAGYSGDPVNAVYIKQLLDRMVNDKDRLTRKLTNPSTWGKQGERMTFNAIVGNPPYQEMDGGNNASAIPIYQKFIEQAISVNPKYISMIIPSRWFAGGRGLDKFRDLMMNNTHIRKLREYSDSKFIFQTADISGGICYFLIDNEYDGPCEVTNVDNGQKTSKERYLNEFSIIVRSNKAIDILHKVLSRNEDLLSNHVSAMKPFGLRTYEKPDETGKLILRWNKGKGPVEEDRITAGHTYIDKWKVISSRVFFEHAGQPDKNGQYRVLSVLEVLQPKEVCTETYVIIDAFDSQIQAENLYKYLKTKFARFLILQACSSIMVTKASYIFVPVQDFTSEWTDPMLYKKYELSQEEINCIESTIRDM